MSELNENSSAFWMLVGGRTARGEKVRADAKLKNLRPEARDLVATWCLTPMQRDADGEPIAGTGGNAFARTQLAERADRFSAPWLRVSERGLSDFLSWWGIQQDQRAAKEVQEQVFAETGDPRQAIDAGTTLLAVRGLARQDAKLITLASRIHVSTKTLDLDEASAKTRARQKDEQIALKREELQIHRHKLIEALLAKARDPQVREIVDSPTLSNAEKTQQLGRIMFGEDWDE